MNEKLTNKVVSVISLIGTFLGAFQTVEMIIDKQRSNIVPSVILTLAFALLFIFFHNSKKKYVDLYAVCNSMSLNNRLQSLREIILIKHREIIGNDNKYRIKKAKFYYTLSQSKIDSNAYDLHYSISFKLCKTWLMQRCTKDRTLRFFAITLSASPKNFTSEIITEAEIPIEGQSTIVECAKKNYTTRGESGSNEIEYSGLYEIITVVPPDMAKKKHIEIRFSYDILGQIKKSQDKHNITIIPRNYSTRVDEFEVVVQTKNVQIDNLELQRYGINGEFEIAELFIPCKFSNFPCELSYKNIEKNIDEEIHEHYAFVKPNMSSAYSIQFDLPKQNMEE